MLLLEIGLILGAVVAGYICAFGHNIRYFILIVGIPYLYLFGLPIADSFLVHLPDEVFKYETAGSFPMLPSTLGAIKFALKGWPIAMIGVPISFVIALEFTRIYYVGTGRSLEKLWKR